jgi:penicillin-binding protein 1C
MWQRALAGALVLGTVALCVSLACAPVPGFDAVRAATRSSEAELLDRHGEVLQRLRVARHQRMLAWVPLTEMSPTFPRAVVVAEDQRFAWHPGVDPVGMISALTDNLSRARPRGGSTISMQLASILSGQGSGTRSVGEKLVQMRDALAIELQWTKPQILEAYLNRVSFRGELVGIDAAARGLLAKGPSGLDESESAVLAALIRAPGASRTAVARRACAVLRTQARHGCDAAAYIATTLPQRPYPMRGMDDAPHLAVKLLKAPGERVRTTLDATLQRYAMQVLRSRLAELADRNVEDGAVVVLDNHSGDVLAYVGSSGDLSGSPEVDGASALRQPGSTLKPFLFGVAIEQGWLTAASILDDSPLALTTPSGLYIPQDYDKDFKGAVTVRTALAASLNVPSVRALTLVGVDRFLQTLHALGMNSLDRQADHYGYGLALGGAETTLLTLTNAYRALANGGVWSATQWTTPRANGVSRQVFSPQTGYILADILADPAARAPTFGMASPLSARTWAAVKTGTSKAMRDNWAIGFTDRYTVGVWVGNFSGAPMWDVSGITGAAPIWRDLVDYLHADVASRAPIPASGLVARDIRFVPPIEAPRREWFRAGTEPVGEATRIAVAITPGRARLIAPPDGTVIAPDPDIPAARQSILVQASGPGELCLRVNGRALAPCGTQAALLPLPSPGGHRVELTDRAGNVLDTHEFSVRGIARPRAAPAS